MVESSTKAVTVYPIDSKYTSNLSGLEGRVGPKQRPLMAVSQSSATRLSWSELPENRSQLELVLATVVEPSKYGTNILLVSSDTHSEPFASLDVICSDPYQIHRIPLPVDCMRATGGITIDIKLKNPGQLWFFAPDPSVSGGLEYHVPRIIDTTLVQDSYLDRLASLASIQTFSWKEGCVLDAIWSLGDRGVCPQAKSVIREHLDYFGFSTGDLVYETPSSFRVTNLIDTIETTLPFAHAALLDTEHPWVDLAIQFWKQLVKENGQVQDKHMISSEGAYTVAYPMALIASLRGEEQWFGIAENLLKETFQRLVQPEGVYLRHFQDEGKRTHRNWVRGLCWLILGHVQTLRYLPQPSERIVEQLRFLAEYTAQFQRDDGLWSCFMDSPEILADTSGSAGVAAGMALAAREGYLDAEYANRARRCLSTLRTYIGPEGFLAGCSQSNKAGEDLQRSAHRVSLPYALGLYGQLIAALDVGGS